MPLFVESVPSSSKEEDDPASRTLTKPADLATAILPAVGPFSLDAAETSLFLDLDGTLAEFAETPDAVGPDPVRTDLLRRLDRMLAGRLAIVSGRAIAEVDRILDQALPHVAGVHGLERRVAGGKVVSSDPHAALADAVKVFGAIARVWPNALLEAKPRAVALHYRGDPGLAPVVLQTAREFARASGLRLQEGHMVAELLTPGRDKGGAVRAFMRESPFAGTVPIFVGDDLTDEAAIQAAVDMGGVGIVVGSRRDTAATARLRGVPQVMAWLGASVEQGRFSVGAGA